MKRFGAIRRRSRVLLVGAMLVSVAGCDSLFETDRARIERGLEAVAAGNYGEAYWAWRPLADRGVAEAQYQLAWLYANGDGLRVDLAKAVDWWGRAAADGHRDAEFAIGMAYLNGQGSTFEPDLSRALQWLIFAGRHGQEDARELALELLTTNTDRVLKVYPLLLRESWLGTRVQAKEADTGCFAKRSVKSERVAVIGPESDMRKVDEQGSWIALVTPEGQGLCWAKATEFEGPDSVSQQ